MLYPLRLATYELLYAGNSWNFLYGKCNSNDKGFNMFSRRVFISSFSIDPCGLFEFEWEVLAEPDDHVPYYCLYACQDRALNAVQAQGSF